MRTILLDRKEDRPRPQRRPTAAASLRSEAEMLSLQRAIGNRAVVEMLARRTAPHATDPSPTIQRAVLAIDGATDGKVAKKATANCLYNLKSVKSIKKSKGQKVPTIYSAGDARGEVYGPAGAPAVEASAHDGVARGEVTAKESLYVLGHGSGKVIADLDVTDMATLLNTACADLPGKRPYVGKVKLVACYSASLTVDGKAIKDDSGNPITEPYASQLASQLGAQAGRCRPAEVEGIAGIAWVDEETGKKTGFDVDEGRMSPLEQVYDDKQLEKAWMAALTTKDPAERKRKMDVVLERVQKKYPQYAGMDKRVTGKDARAVFRPTYPKPPPSEPWYKSLLACFGVG